MDSRRLKVSVQGDDKRAILEFANFMNYRFSS